MLRLRRKVYLDNNATTPVSKAVVRKVNKILKTVYGNPSSLYRSAHDAAAVLDDSRVAVASAIGANPEEVIFTGSASEANNQILKSMLEITKGDRRHIISSPIEHQSVMETLRFLEKKGMAVQFCPVDREGRLITAELERMTSSKTLLICVMLANNETGVVQDLKKIVETAKKHGALVMSDCVQALGKISVNVQELGVDYAVFSAHKIHGPKGVGAIYVKEGSPILPFIHGGHQEHGLRAGTEGTHNIAGFAEACSKTPAMLDKAVFVKSNKNYFIKEIKQIKPDVIINSPIEHCLPNTLNITFPGLDNAAFMGFLDYYGIGVSAGSACNTQVNEPSHVLKAIGLSDEAARQTLRFSLSDRTTEHDIRYALSVISNYIKGDKLPVAMISPGQLNEDMLFHKDTFILDVRYWHDRKILKALPNAHEASTIFLGRYLYAVPKEKHVITVCQTGLDGPVAAYYLRSRGYKDVGFVAGGLASWRLVHPDLYEKFAGQNVTQLPPKKRNI
jgi:cysteine desulfurase